jgi:hypothetical protein
MYGYPQSHTFSFDYKGTPQNISLSLDTTVKNSYALASHQYQYSGRLPRDWRTDYYAMYTDRADDVAVIRDLLDQIRQLAPGASRDELADLATAFVQGAIAYDWETFHNIDQGQIRYPYETLWDAKGVCADKSILLAKILRELEYDLVIFTFERANHMALGLRAPAGFGHYRSDFTFVESTAPTPIGRVPDTYVGGIKLENNPLIVPVKGAGRHSYQKIEANRAEENVLEKQYGKDYLSMSSGQQGIKQKMTLVESEMAEMKKALRGCKGTLSQEKYHECMRLQETYNSKVNAFNKLVAEFNAMNG